MSGQPERLAPREFVTAISAAQQRKLRGEYGLEVQAQRAARTLRDRDLHRIFKVGREIAYRKPDGSVKELHRITAADQANAIVLVGYVKRIAGLEPQKHITDTELLKRLRRDLGEKSWSLSRVRRTRRLCEAAGLCVRSMRSDGIPGIAEPQWEGALWVLDRRLTPVEPAPPPEPQLSRGLVTSNQARSIRAGEKPFSLRSNEGKKPPPRAGPGPGNASAVVKAVLRELRLEERRSRRAAQPTTAERLDGLVLQLVYGLFLERQRVRLEWGDAVALEHAADAALRLRADPERVAAARGRLAARLLGEQLRLEQDGGEP